MVKHCDRPSRKHMPGFFSAVSWLDPLVLTLVREGEGWRRGGWEKAWRGSWWEVVPLWSLDGGVGREATPTRTSGFRAWAQHPPLRLRAPPARPRSKVNTGGRDRCPARCPRASHGGGVAGLPHGQPRPATGHHPVVSIGTGRGGRTLRIGREPGRIRGEHPWFKRPPQRTKAHTCTRGPHIRPRL